LRALGFASLAAVGLVLLVAGAGLPRFGDPHSPASLHVASVYLRGSYADAHTPNVVTTMIADYRGFDTLGETMVVLSAGLACMLLLRRRGGRLPAIAKPKGNLIVDVITRAMVPVIQIFALYVGFHGHYSPGGGFQGGALAAGSILLARIALGHDRSQALFPARLGTPLGLLGLLVYAGVGVAALALGGNALDYGRLPFDFPPAELRSFGILAVEIGVALAVTGTLVSIFDDLATGGR
jgi:multicomponent Na+:H+ antiporter subunit B